jgi:hypothetical protein
MVMPPEKACGLQDHLREEKNAVVRPHQQDASGVLFDPGNDEQDQEKRLFRR